MSRDWTPAELYIADKAMAKEYGRSLRESELMFVDTNSGEKVPLSNKQARADYPELSFLFGEFDRLYESYKDDKALRALFDRFEVVLVETEKLLGGEIPHSKELYKMGEKEFLSQPVETVVREWFLGRLDSDFYYNERNNAAFRTFFANEMRKVKEHTAMRRDEGQTNSELSELVDCIIQELEECEPKDGQGDVVSSSYSLFPEGEKTDVSFTVTKVTYDADDCHYSVCYTDNNKAKVNCEVLGCDFTKEALMETLENIKKDFVKEYGEKIKKENGYDTR